MTTLATSNYLLDEYPLVVLPGLAKALGDVNEAVFLQQVHYWLVKAQKAGKPQVDGKWWTYNSLTGWQEQFPWMTYKGVQHVFDRLRKKGLVIVKHLQPSELDRRLSYTIDYEKLQMHYSPRSNALVSTEQCPIPETSGTETSQTTSPPAVADGMTAKPRKPKTQTRSPKQLVYDEPLKTFADAYKQVYSSDYVLSGSDYGVLKILMAQVPTDKFLPEFKSRVALAVRRHTPGNKWEEFPTDLTIFKSRWNKLVEAGPARAKETEIERCEREAALSDKMFQMRRQS